MLQIKGNFNEGIRDIVAFRKWEWIMSIALVIGGTVGTFIALYLIFSPLVGR